MRIHNITAKLAQRHRQAKQDRAIYNAVRNAPTPAMRDELLSLTGR